MNHARARRAAASQDGFALIEVVVSAAVLVIVVLGVLAAIDAVTGTAGANKARTVAATLAEQDQERLRAMRTEDLGNLATIQPSPREVKVNGVTYTIASAARYVTEGGDEEVGCAATGDGAYLRITSTVTSPMTGAKVKPVTIHSIVSPRPGRGTLSAVVEDAKGAPVAGLTVSAAGATPGTAVTNSQGCAVFVDRDAGSYQVGVNSGCVDTGGTVNPVKQGTVSAGTVSTVEIVCDRPAAFSVEVRTRKGANAGSATTVTDLSQAVIAAHTGMPTGTRLVSAGTSAGQSTFAFTSMFPFPTPYQLYSGKCSGADPSKLDTAYFTRTPESTVQLVPGGNAGTRIVYEPALDVRVRTVTLLPVAGVRAWLYPTAEGCVGTAPISLGTTGSDGRLPAAQIQGHPFGPYKVCVDINTGTTRNPIWNRSVKNYTNANPLFTNVVDFEYLLSAVTWERASCGSGGTP